MSRSASPAASNVQLPILSVTGQRAKTVLYLLILSRLKFQGILPSHFRSDVGTTIILPFAAMYAPPVLEYL